MTNSRVSIVVCTRDRPENLKSLLESVARLAPKPYEILIVDQSATSRTERIVAEYGHIVGLRYLHQAAVGLSRARNFGVAESQGDIVAFTDEGETALSPVCGLDSVIGDASGHSIDETNIIALNDRFCGGYRWPKSKDYKQIIVD